MSKKSSCSLCAIGNSITDYNALVTDEFLSNHKIRKSSMSLVSSEYIDTILADISDIKIIAGGSVANSSVVFSILGDIFSNNLQSSFIGICGNDLSGSNFISDIDSYGVLTRSISTSSNTASSKCLCLTTPDGSRSLLTYLGASLDLDYSDMDHPMITGSDYTLLEGYILDCPNGIDIIRRVSSMVSRSSGRTVFCLSDIGVIERHHKYIYEYLQSGVCDILLCNLYELCSLLISSNYLHPVGYSKDDFNLIDFCDQLGSNLEQIANSEILKSWIGNFAVNMLVLTCGSAGSIVLSCRGDSSHYETVFSDRNAPHSTNNICKNNICKNNICKTASFPVSKVVDTTGAGDYFCGGFLFGLANGFSISSSSRLGCLCGSCIVGERGTRSSSLSKSVKKIYRL